MGCTISSSRTHSPTASPARSANVRSDLAGPSHSPSLSDNSNVENRTSVNNDSLVALSNEYLRTVLAETDQLIHEINQARNELGNRVNRVNQAATNLKKTLESRIAESTASSIDYATILQRIRQDFALIKSDF